jgi:hypothetical protein
VGFRHAPHQQQKRQQQQVITAKQLARINTTAVPTTTTKKVSAFGTNHDNENNNNDDNNSNDDDNKPLYQPADWLSDAVPTDTEDENEEEEEAGRRALIEALKNTATSENIHRRFCTLSAVAENRGLVGTVGAARAATAAEAVPKAAVADFGRDFCADDDGGVTDEAVRNLRAALASAPTALAVLAELNKKKELTAVRHASVAYWPVAKKVYRVSQAAALLTHYQVLDRRAKLRINVRGQGAQAPVRTFAETGLPLAMLDQLAAHHIVTPSSRARA